MIFSLGGGLSFLVFIYCLLICFSYFCSFSVKNQLRRPFAEPPLFSLFSTASLSLSLSVHIMYLFLTSVCCLVSHHLDTDGESESCKHISAATCLTVKPAVCPTVRVSADWSQISFMLTLTETGVREKQERKLNNNKHIMTQWNDFSIVKKKSLTQHCFKIKQGKVESCVDRMEGKEWWRKTWGKEIDR